MHIMYRLKLAATRRIIVIVTFITTIFLFTSCVRDSQPIETALSESPNVSSVAPTLKPSLSPSPIITTPPDETPRHSDASDPSERGEVQNGKVTIEDGFYYYKLNDAIKKRITGMSFPSNGSEEITYDDLRYIRLKYYDFGGNEHDDGELIVNVKLAAEVTRIFYKLYEKKYEFTSINLVDDYGEPGDDNISMAANNTSAFNYRHITGSKKLSLHSYGAAIDINPKMNPYIKKDGSISPANGAEYADRSLHIKGMIYHDDLAFKLFKAEGWSWGGDSKTEKDYQHFSKKIY